MTQGTAELLEEIETTAGLTTWKLDGAHSSAGFSVKHMMITNVRGDFKEIEGTLQFDANNIADSSVAVTIQTASVDTREPNRDTHLRSADFFDVEKYPAITFRSTEFTTKGAGELYVKGDLTIHGVTREVVLAVEGPSEELKDPWGGTRIAFSATAKISRKEFNLVYNAALETGGVLIGDEIKLAIDAQFVKQ